MKLSKLGAVDSVVDYMLGEEIFPLMCSTSSSSQFHLIILPGIMKMKKTNLPFFFNVMPNFIYTKHFLKMFRLL